MRKAAARTGLIVLMLTGGLLSAGISQAQDIGAADAQERAAELVAASGGPAASAHLIAFAADKAAVEVRADDVADVQPAAAAVTSASEVGVAAQPVDLALPAPAETAPSRQIARAEQPTRSH
jgi:glycerol kinase